MIDAHTATAKDFDRAAQRNANAFWVWAVIAAICSYYFRWWGLIPGTLAILNIVKSVAATRCADQLRNGTYRLPNLNNGAPDGDVANR
jgi:hypothetical protein